MQVQVSFFVLAGVQVEAIPRAAEIARLRIEEEVLGPLHEWLASYTKSQVCA
jgi:hypothetical protein